MSYSVLTTLLVLGLCAKHVMSDTAISLLMDTLPFSFSYFGSVFTFISIYPDGYVLLNDTAKNEIRISVASLGLNVPIDNGPFNGTDDLKMCSNVISAQFSKQNSFKFNPTIGYQVTWSLGTIFTGRIALVTDFFYSFFIMAVYNSQLDTQSRYTYSNNTYNFTATVGQYYAFQSSLNRIGENYTVQCSRSYIIVNTTTAACNVVVFNTNLNYFNPIQIGYSFCQKNSTLSQQLTYINQTLILPFEISCDTPGSQSLTLQNLNTDSPVAQTTITVYPAVSVVSQCSTGLNFVNKTDYSCLIMLSNSGPSFNGTLSYQFCSTSESASISSLSGTQGVSMQINLTCSVPGYQVLQIQLTSNDYNKTVYEQTVLVQSVINNFLSYGSSSESFLPASSNYSNCQANISLGFTFRYFANSYSTISVCAGGYVTLGSGGESIYLNQGGQYFIDSGSVSYFTNITSGSLLSSMGTYASAYYKTNAGFQFVPKSGFLVTWNQVSAVRDSKIKLSGQLFLVTDGLFSFFGVVFGQINNYMSSYFMYNFNQMYSFVGNLNTSNVNLTAYYIFKSSGSEESYSVGCDRKYYIVGQAISCHLNISNVNQNNFMAENVLYSIGGQNYTIEITNDGVDAIGYVAPNSYDMTETSLIPGVNELLVLNDNIYFNNTIWSQNLSFYPQLSLTCNYKEFSLTTLDSLVCQIGAVSNPNGLMADLSICYGDDSNCTYGPLSLSPFTFTKKYTKPGSFLLTVSSPQRDASVLSFLNQTVQVSLKIAYNLTCNQNSVMANSSLECNISLTYMGQINVTFVKPASKENISTPFASQITTWSTLRTLLAPSVQGNYTLMLIGPGDESVSNFSLLVKPQTTTTTKTTRGPTSAGETVQLIPIIMPPKPNSIRTDMPFGNSSRMLSLLSNYTGDLSDCLINCTNNGDCVYNSTTALFICSCFSYYSGSGCQVSLDPCSSSPCLNNGTCGVYAAEDDIDNLVYQCDCGDGLYYGTNCQNKIDLCANVTCSGKGNCKVNSTTDEAYCECLYLYSGENCQTESSRMKVVKNVVNTTSIIAIVIISGLYVLAIVLDLLKLF